MPICLLLAAISPSLSMASDRVFSCYVKAYGKESGEPVLETLTDQEVILSEFAPEFMRSTPHYSILLKKSSTELAVQAYFDKAQKTLQKAGLLEKGFSQRIENEDIFMDLQCRFVSRLPQSTNRSKNLSVKEKKINTPKK